MRTAPRQPHPADVSNLVFTKLLRRLFRAPAPKENLCLFGQVSSSCRPQNKGGKGSYVLQVNRSLNTNQVGLLCVLLCFNFVYSSSLPLFLRGVYSFGATKE